MEFGWRWTGSVADADFWFVSLNFPQTKMKQFKTYITEWRHSIRDSTIDLDHRPLVIKDLMTQLCTIWNDLPPIDTVVWCDASFLWFYHHRIKFDVEWKIIFLFEIELLPICENISIPHVSYRKKWNAEYITIGFISNEPFQSCAFRIHFLWSMVASACSLP